MGGSTSVKTQPQNNVSGPYMPRNKKFNKTYNLSRELGHGAFSVVKLGVHKQTQEPFAVKLVNTRKVSESEMTALRMEIDILYGLTHPHIIKLTEVYEEGFDFFIVTELVRGGELFDRIVSKSYYTEKEARDLIRVFLETMKYLHEKGIVHRDIKPENLLLRSEDDDTDIALADFGFAKRVVELNDKEDACGTPNYVAPEILRGDTYGCEVDIWSMGVVCYILLAGYAPFYEDNQKKLFEKIKKGRYHFHEEYWSRISPEAIDLVSKMMTVDQESRWTASQLLQHPWILKEDKELSGQDISSTIKELKRYNARRRLKAAANAVIMANRMQNLLGIKSKFGSNNADDDATVPTTGDQ